MSWTSNIDVEGKTLKELVNEVVVWYLMIPEVEDHIENEDWETIADDISEGVAALAWQAIDYTEHDDD